MIRQLSIALLTSFVALGHAAAAVEIGKPAPSTTGKDENGKEHRLADYKGKIVVLEWTNSECPFVVRHYRSDTMEKLAKIFAGKEVVWLAVNSSHFNTPEDTKAWAKKEGFAYPTLQDPVGVIGKAWGAKTTPHMFVVDDQGIVRYAGAIDDDPRGNKKEAKNFVDGAVRALMAESAPNPASTTPYGCSVKYQ